MRESSPKRRGSRCGAATVEFAAVVPVFFLFIFGIIEVGRGMMVTHLLNNGAREGCRLGIISGKSSSEIASRVSTVLATQGINNVSTTVRVNGSDVDAVNAANGAEIRVQVRVPIENVSWLPGGQYIGGNLLGQYSLRRE